MPGSPAAVLPLMVELMMVVVSSGSFAGSVSGMSLLE
jgi:hypothetical protein